MIFFEVHIKPMYIVYAGFSRLLEMLTDTVKIVLVCSLPISGAYFVLIISATYSNMEGDD